MARNLHCNSTPAKREVLRLRFGCLGALAWRVGRLS
jgi:hypothetical protein